MSLMLEGFSSCYTLSAMISMKSSSSFDYECFFASWLLVFALTPAAAAVFLQQIPTV